MAQNKSNNNPKPIHSQLAQNEKYMEQTIGANISYDIGFRELIILKTNIQLYYVNGLVDDANITQLLKMLIEINDDESDESNSWNIIQNRLVNQQVEIIDSMDEAVDQLLSGLIVIFVDHYPKAFVIDVRMYPARSPDEPDTERVIRGSRDGFTENIQENTALTRRRIRDERLRHEMVEVGERSKTDVCLCYLQDVVNDDLLQLIKEKISQIEIDGLTMADKALEEFISTHQWNPYPFVRYTERPDVAADHILDGHIVIMVDTSPSVIIAPTTFFDHLEHAEESRQTPAVGTFIRWVRFLAVLASLYLLPLWMLFVLEPSLLPEKLSFIGPNDIGNIPIFWQIFLADIGVEFMRMAAVHTPTPLATAMGLIAAVLIGEIAVDVGMFTPEVILYVAISSIGTYVTPSYELSIANKITKLLLLILTALFTVKGFVFGVIAHILVLGRLRSIRIPYLWPFIPFNAEAMLFLLFRLPVPKKHKRPIFVRPKNIYRQPNR